MLSDRDFYRATQQSLGQACYLAVAKLTDAAHIRRTTSIPTVALASKRFEIGVLSSCHDWIAAGALSGSHVGMLFSEPPVNLEAKISGSLRAFAFTDPWGGSGRVDLAAAVVVIPLLEIKSLKDLVQAIDTQLTEATAALPPRPTDADRCEALVYR